MAVGFLTGMSQGRHSLCASDWYCFAPLFEKEGLGGEVSTGVPGAR